MAGWRATDAPRALRRINRHRYFAAAARLLGVTLVVTLTATLISTLAMAAPPTGFQTSLIVGDGLDGPSGFEIAPDGRIFVLERTGKIKVIKDGQLLPTPFADLPSEATGDRGLIGIAFDPEFGVANHFVYFYYTGHDLLNHLVRYNASDDVGQDGPFPLFTTSSPSQLLHVGGSIRFGPDGKLYFAVGDNGNGANAQDLSNPHGKILRINKDGSIPEDNPFVGQPGKLGAIWAYGLRNPWRFQFDSSTGDMYGGDVGDFSWEEVNHIVKGGNYGWPLKEGPCQSGCAGFTDPVYAYPHDGQSSAVTGGPIYRASMFPAEYQGNLFFADYARGFIKRAVLGANGSITSVTDFDAVAGPVVDLKVAPDGSLYYLSYYPGALYRVSYNTNSHLPVAAASADVTKGLEPLAVHFSSNGSSDPDGDPLSFHWDFGDGTSSAEANPTKLFAGKGVYTVHLTVTANGEQSHAQPIVVQVGVPPTLIVASPLDTDTYYAGDTITWNAFASDAAGFDLNDANITTVVRLHHGTHFHPFLGPVSGRAGSFTVPVTGEASADTSYEVTITATDSNGLFTSKVMSVHPVTAQLTLATSPPGLGLYLDAVPLSTPHVTRGVAGFHRDLSAPVHAIAADGTELQFAGWSDGHNVNHMILTPAVDTTYTAVYLPVPAFTAEYYNNPSLSGTPALTRQDPKVDFDWDQGSPAPSIADNQFSVRWSKSQYFGAGRYVFTTKTDDGVRLYIDNTRVVDHWEGASGLELTYAADLGEGMHAIRMEYYEGGGGAQAHLRWDATPEQPSETFHAQYWNLNGGPVAIPSSAPDLVRDEAAINYEWGVGSPAPVIGANLFVARWTRTLSLAPGYYQFTTATDDGVRLTIDGRLVIDKWIDQATSAYSVTLPMDGAAHTITMDYYESGGVATAKLAMVRTGDLPAAPAWHGEYWNVVNTGSPPVIPATPPTLVRDDTAVAFDWYDGSPAPEITANYFVARWNRTDVLSAGVYRFSGSADDGIRVYVDNVPIIDMWQYQHAAFSVDKVLGPGAHVIRIEFFEGGSGAQAIVDYQRLIDAPTAPPTGGDGYAAEYFSNPDLGGTPALSRIDLNVDFDWGTGAPGNGVPADNFSVRWTRTITVDAGVYAFTVTGDDGVRLYVDGDLVLNKWVLQGPTTYEVLRQLTVGEHQIVMEYFESGGGAMARLSYAASTEPAPPEPPVAGKFAAQFYDNADLAGTAVLTRNDDAVDYDWGFYGSPGAGIPMNNFSARWTRTLDYAAGTYRLSITGDDGIRLYVDGNLVLDGWYDHSPMTFTTDLSLAAGQHTVVIEYYERGGGATARYSEIRL